MRLIFVILFSFISLIAFAGTPVKVKSGNNAILKDGVKALVEFDFSQTSWEKDKSFKEFCGDDYDERIKLMSESFVETFNTMSSGMKLTADVQEANYKLILYTSTLYRRQNMWAWGSFHIEMYGNIEIIDIKSNNVICLIDIDELDGSNSFTPNDRLRNVYEELAKQIVNMKIKSKK